MQPKGTGRGKCLELNVCLERGRWHCFTYRGGFRIGEMHHQKCHVLSFVARMLLWYSMRIGGHLFFCFTEFSNQGVFILLQEGNLFFLFNCISVTVIMAYYGTESSSTSATSLKFIIDVCDCLKILFVLACNIF